MKREKLNPGDSGRRVILYIAMSLDGYIADRDGGVDWLTGHGQEDEDVDSYSEFIKSVDTVVMGWNTFYQVRTVLSPEEWAYAGLTSYVVTHREKKSAEDIRFTKEHPGELVERLKKEPGKDIWICGGAQIVQQLTEKNMIDVFHIAVIPVILGSGIRLFGDLKNELRLKLLGTQRYNGITELIYTRR